MPGVFYTVIRCRPHGPNFWRLRLLLWLKFFFTFLQFFFNSLTFFNINNNHRIFGFGIFLTLKNIFTFGGSGSYQK